jgi:hypothetical protein
MTSVIDSRPGKLPLWRTIGQAYGLWGENLLELIRICWLWMLIMAPVLALLQWWQAPHLEEIMQAARAGRPDADPNPVLTLMAGIVGRVIMLPALASIAVAWHRLLLRDEHPQPGPYLRLDHVVAGYAILAFWIGLIMAGAGFASTLFQAVTGTSPTPGSPGGSIFQILVGLVTIVAFFVGARLSIALPAMALEREDVTLGAAWRASKGNSWRMVWAYFFCVLPWGLIAAGLGFALLRQPSADRVIVSLVAGAVGALWIPVGMVSVGMLSLAYRHFFERKAWAEPFR